MKKEEYELIELPGLNEERLKEYCLICTKERTRRVCLVKYPSYHRLLHKYKFFKRVNFN